MEEKTLVEWIEFYEKKSKETFVRKEGFSLIYFPDKGFAEIGIDMERQTLLIYRVAGDIKAWWQIIHAIGQFLGFTRYSAVVIRHIKPFLRLCGGTITEEKEVELGTCYNGTPSDGRPFTAYPVHKNGKEHNYLVIWGWDDGE